MPAFKYVTAGDDDFNLCMNYVRNILSFAYSWASLVVHMVKNLPAMWETQVQSLGQEDPLEEEMATHFSILAWRIPWTEEPGGLQSMGSQRVGLSLNHSLMHAV